jgi:hypothetical protein
MVFVRLTAAARCPTVKVRLILETMMFIYVSGPLYMVTRARFHNAWLTSVVRVGQPIKGPPFPNGDLTVGSALSAGPRTMNIRFPAQCSRYQDPKQTIGSHTLSRQDALHSLAKELRRRWLVYPCTAGEGIRSVIVDGRP